MEVNNNNKRCNAPENHVMLMNNVPVNMNNLNETNPRLINNTVNTLNNVNALKTVNALTM